MLLALLAACAGVPPSPGELAARPPAVTVPIALAGIEDARVRFRELFCAVLAASQRPPGAVPCARLLHGPPDAGATPTALGPPRHRLRVLLVSGFASDCFASSLALYAGARGHLQTLGWRLQDVPIESLSSSAANAAIVAREVMAAPLEANERLVLLGYSKGTADILEALLRHAEIRGRVAAVVSVAGAVGGSQLAEAAPGVFDDLMELVGSDACGWGDAGAVASLTPSRRLGLLAEAPLPDGILYVSLGDWAPRAEVAALLRPTWDLLAAIDPRNDGQLVVQDQVIPKGALLGYARADHFAVALDLLPEASWTIRVFLERNAFPRTALIEAILRFVDERLAAA